MSTSATQRTTALIISLAFSALPVVADPATAPAAMTALEAGARYGQALGAVEVCYGSTVTDKAKGLEATFTGTDLETFKAQAAKIYEAWRKVKGCTNQFDPNQCKIIMDKSCLAAEAEIGAAGTAMAGLVDFMKH